MKGRSIKRILSLVLVSLLVIQNASWAATPVMAATGTRLGNLSISITRSISGNTTTFTANPSTSYAGGSYTYQWQYSPNGGTSWANISGATGKTYSVNTSALTGQYQYRCQGTYTFVSDDSYALVNDAYIYFLNRNAENEGNQNWWNHLVNHTIIARAKVTTSQISGCAEPVNEAAALAIVIGMSPEGSYTGHPYGSGAGPFVTACYRFLLGREPDTGGYNGWVNVYNTYSSNIGYIIAPDGSYVAVNEGAVRVINGIAGNPESKSYMSSKYAYDSSTGQFTYTQAQTYVKTSTYYVDGTSEALSLVEYAVTCEDRVGNSSGALLGTQPTKKSYTNGHSVSGSAWGSNTSDNAYYRGYKYTGCSTVTVDGVCTVYRYFEKLPDNVTYDYTTNGGSSISVANDTAYYPVGETISLAPTANKNGYSFIGWNTDKDAREGLASLTKSSSDVTLYAIFRKELTYSYYTMTPANDFSETGYLFNNESTIYSNTAGTTPLVYADYESKNFADAYNFVGYTFDRNKNNNQSLIASGDEITDTDNTDIYCVYQADGTLEYYDTQSNKMASETDTGVFYGTVSVLPSLQFTYIAKAYTPRASYQFDGWSDGARTYQAGDTVTTTSSLTKLYASESPIKVSSITVSPAASVVHIGDTKQLSAMISPTDALNQSVEWTSSNPSIASVDATGKVTANAIGPVTITAKTQDGTNLSAVATVSVAGKVKYDATTNGGSLTGDADRYYELNEEVDLTRVAAKDGYTFLGWNTDENARVGLVSLTMTTSNMTLYAIYRKDITYTYHSCDDSQIYQQTGYLFNNETVVYDDEAGMIVATYMAHDDIFSNLPYEFKGFSVSSTKDTDMGLFTSGDISETEDTDFYGVYKVEGTMKELSATGEELTTKTCTRYTTVVGLADVIFEYNLDDYVPATGYSFIGWEHNGQKYDAGETLITGMQDITVQAVEDQIMVNSLTVSPKVKSLYLGESVDLTVEILPSDALDTSVTYTSSDLTIASVSDDGVVTAQGLGNATITISANDGSGLEETVRISVVEERTILLCGVVKDINGNGVSGCDITVTYDNFAQRMPLSKMNKSGARSVNRSSVTITTKEDGSFEFEGLVFGRYTMEISKEDVSLVVYELVLGEDGTDIINVRAKGDITTASYDASGDMISFCIEVEEEKTGNEDLTINKEVFNQKNPITGDKTPITAMIAVVFSCLLGFLCVCFHKKN